MLATKKVKLKPQCYATAHQLTWRKSKNEPYTVWQAQSTQNSPAYCGNVKQTIALVSHFAVPSKLKHKHIMKILLPFS